jgi:pyruvate,orthophosphate dikinase
VLFGEFLINAQGEDVVAGIRTPKPISELNREMPASYQQLLDLCRLLERHFKDMQDIEFTIEEGKLYILQTRSGKRTAASAIRIAVDLVKEGLITKEESVLRVLPAHLEQLVHRSTRIIRPDQSQRGYLHHQAQLLAGSSSTRTKPID